MSAIEESGIPLEVHLNEWKKMLKLVEKGGDLVFATQAKGRIKELEESIEQQKPEEKKLEWICLREGWEWRTPECDGEKKGYWFQIRCYRPATIGGGLYSLLLCRGLYGNIEVSVKDTLEEAQVKAEEIAKVLELV